MTVVYWFRFDSVLDCYTDIYNNTRFWFRFQVSVADKGEEGMWVLKG